MAKQSVTVWDDEGQIETIVDGRPAQINQWGPSLLGRAVVKGMPADAQFWTRRNDARNGTIFEWDNA